MPVFECQVRTNAGEARQMTLEAPTQQTALERLHQEGHFVLRVLERPDRRSKGRGLLSSGRTKLDELVAFSREFAVMIRAGIPMIETIETLREHMKPGALQSALEYVQQDIEGGQSMSASMRRMPHAFPALYVNLIRAAEAGGNLDQVLKRAADYLNESLALQRKVKSAMMYPAIVMIATMFVMAYMITFIMPKFSDMFRQMNVELPITTRFLVALGDLGDKNKILVLLSPLVVIGLSWGAWQVPRIRNVLSYWAARLPMVGDLTRKVVITRTLSAMQTLLAAGVSLGQALEIAADSSGDFRMQKAMRRVRSEVEGARQLAECLKETGMFPSLVIQLVAAGEKTGAMPEMLGEIVAFYDDEVQQKLKGLTSVLEPVMMLFLGVVIGVFALSVISPIYNLMGTIK